MEYLKQLREIDSDIYQNMGKTSQIVIDLVQDTIQELDRDIEERPIERDELGAINYDVAVLLEVYNPDLIFDIDILKRFNKIIEDWRNDVEFVNRALGIPPEKG